MAGYVQAGYVDSGYVSDAGRGLEYGVTAIVDAPNKTFQITVDTTGQNWYSFMVEVWRTESALFNVAFPLQANGPNSFTLLDDWEFVDGWESLKHVRRDGIRYVNAAGTQTAVWAAILSSGVPAGFQVRYQQQDGLNTTNALRTGNIDQLIQVYGDATHGNFDYRNWLVCKVQAEGYDQAESVVDDLYGTLEDQLYVIGLTPLANGIAAGLLDPTVTVTPEPTPVLWNGSYFSTTITDTTDTHSGLEIMQSVRAENEFNWSDLVRPNGDKFKTVTGNFYGDLYTTPAGVRVVMADGTTPHPDFNLFNDDTGSSPYSPPVVANISITNLPVAGNLIRLQIFNLSTDTIIYSGDPGGTSYTDSYVDGVGITAGNTLRVRFVELNAGTSFKSFSVLVEATVDGFNIDGNNYIETDDVYATNAVDGSSLTVTNKFSADFALPNPQINLRITSNFIAAEYYAYWRYLLTDETGIGVFWGGLTAPDVGNYRINVSVVDMYLDNETTASKRQTDAARIYRSDGTYPVLDPTTSGYGIDLNWQNVVYVVSTGGSALTPTESAQLMALPSAVANASEVLAAAQVTPIQATSQARVIEGAITEAEATRIMLAALAGRVSKAGANIKFKSINGLTDRIDGTVDDQGNRTAVALDGA
jgi:hypothetical protein